MALASVALVIVHIFGTVAHGAWNYLNKFVNIRMLVDIPKKVFKDPTVLLINPVKIFVGLLEIIGEIAKAASLSFRLFGNIFAGEVLLSAMSAIFAFLVPLPFIALEIMVGLIQAMIFSILILIYTSVSMAPEEEEA